MTSINQDRRRLFKRRNSTAIRPPWSRNDIEFTDLCSRCGLCIAHCETAILVKGDGGFPEVDFSQGRGECTFCQKCVKSCPEPIFVSLPNLNKELSEHTDLKSTVKPWKIKAHIAAQCLALNGIWCQSCKDHCDERAIKFTPQLGTAPKPTIEITLCTGCGACVQPCPNTSISIFEPEAI